MIIVVIATDRHAFKVESLLFFFLLFCLPFIIAFQISVYVSGTARRDLVSLGIEKYLPRGPSVPNPGP